MLVDRRLLKNLDWPLIFVTLLLVSIGVLMVYSSTHANTTLTGGDPFVFARKQIIAVMVGISLIVLVMTFDYHISDRGQLILYLFNLVLLASVMLLGREINGAKSWIRIGPLGIQPSEFAKIILILTLGKHLSNKEHLSSFYDLVSAFVHVVPPLALIMLQPDLGTGLVFVAVLFGMLLIAGARPVHLGAIIGTGIAVIALVFILNHFFGFPPVPLKPYQISRLTAFVNPERDQHGAGYNVIQAMTAVGSGRFFGKGLFHSTQGRLNFLPEHHTDFIFAVFGEEFGFFGSFLLLCGYFFLCWRALRVAQHAKDRFGGLVAGGIVCMWLFHLLVNVGMNMGIMPITGIPLPFFSSGGSSMMANLMAVGLLLNIWSRRLKIMF